jgi:hypothetical protein
MHLQSNTAYRLAAGLALAAALTIIWLNAAAGLIGIVDDDPANLLYVAVLAIGFLGAVIARLRPAGLSRTMFAMALALAAVAVVALQLPNTASSVQILTVHAVFVGLLTGAALLFRYSARQAVSPQTEHA